MNVTSLQRTMQPYHCRITMVVVGLLFSEHEEASVSHWQPCFFFIQPKMLNKLVKDPMRFFRNPQKLLTFNFCCASASKLCHGCCVWLVTGCSCCDSFTSQYYLFGMFLMCFVWENSAFFWILMFKEFLCINHWYNEHSILTRRFLYCFLFLTASKHKTATKVGD